MFDNRTDDFTLEAEKGLLSDIIRHPNTIVDVADIVEPKDFAEPSHQIIYSNILEIVNQGRKLGFLNLVQELRGNNQLDKVGSEKYITEIISPDASFNVGVTADEASKIVKESSRKRELNLLAREMLDQSQAQSPTSADDILGVTERDLFRISQESVKSESQVQVSEIFADTIGEIYERGEAEEGTVFGVPTGFEELDSMTTGLYGGQFIIIAARPGVGKSTLAVDFCRNAAYRAGKSVLFFSLEMSNKELLQRILAAETHTELARIKKGELEVEDWKKFQDVAETITEASFSIDDAPDTTITQMRAKAIRQKNSPTGLDMIVIDYLQLMRSSGTVENRQQEVSEFSRSLKLLAKELDVPVVALSQLNRGSENRSDKTPMISDLRESGSLEQDADMVMLINRPEVTDPNDHPGQAFLNLAKNRNGETGTVNLTSLLVFSKFAERGKYEIIEEPPEEDDEAAARARALYEHGVIDDIPLSELNKLAANDTEPNIIPHDDEAPEGTMPAW